MQPHHHGMKFLIRFNEIAINTGLRKQLKIAEPL